MKRIALLAAFLALGACGSFGLAQPHTLSLAYKSGDTYKYRFHSSTRQTAVVSGMSVTAEIDIAAGESAKVNSVDSSGTADVTITFSDFTVKTVTGGITNTTTGMPASSVDVKIAADGTISSINGSTILASNPIAGFSGIGGGFFITAVLPDHAVKPGDTWSKTYDQAAPADFLSGKTHITSHSTYLRDETLNGVTAAVVETKSTGSIELTPASSTARPTAIGGVTMNGTFTTDVTTWIDTGGHVVMKSHGTAHDDVTIDFSGMQTGGASNTKATPGFPVFDGPVTATGDSTTDLSPA